MLHRIRRRAKATSRTPSEFTETASEDRVPVLVPDEWLWAGQDDARVPSHDQVAGTVMPWTQPLVIDGAMAVCAGCGTYRDWLVISTRGEIWLRCRAGHQQRETRLDAAWFNQHSAPASGEHETFEDCLRHLGH
ncbi:hypothetical protein [Streptomyces acidiscabies]|uniref:hypothetical protein n=1 Tax=Streptomyces acidiscabies TaxID=42234 RepID=UPI0002FC5C85